MMQIQPLLEVSSLTKRFGGFTALDDLNFSIYPGERLSLIGPNGSGKSTTVNCISGALGLEIGTITFEGEKLNAAPPHQRIRLGIARTFQIPRPFTSMSVLGNIEIPQIFAARESGHSTSSKNRLAEAKAILDSVGLGGKIHERSSSLTQVDMRKLELARAIAASPKLLIADESMAGLSSGEVDEILQLLLGLKERGIAVLLIEHIMSAVMSFSERIIVLVAGKKIADDVPQAIISNPDVVKAYLGE
jgi:branched-chain amino acid transport system ATP-binding protein